MEAECRNSLQAGCVVDLTSQKCWGGEGKTLESLPPAIYFHWCSSDFCCSLHPWLLFIQWHFIRKSNTGQSLQDGQPTNRAFQRQKKRAVQVKTKGKVNQINFCQSSGTSDCSGQWFKDLIHYTKRPENNYFCGGRGWGSLLTVQPCDFHPLGEQERSSCPHTHLQPSCGALKEQLLSCSLLLLIITNIHVPRLLFCSSQVTQGYSWIFFVSLAFLCQFTEACWQRKTITTKPHLFLFFSSQFYFTIWKKHQ